MGLGPPPAGCRHFRDIMLLGIESGRIDSVYNHHAETRRAAPCGCTRQSEIDGAGCTWEMEVTAPCGKTVFIRPQLARLRGNCRIRRFGVRTGTAGSRFIRLRWAVGWNRRRGGLVRNGGSASGPCGRIKREKDQWGESFELESTASPSFPWVRLYPGEQYPATGYTARTRELLGSIRRSI